MLTIMKGWDHKENKLMEWLFLNVPLERKIGASKS